MRKRRVDRSWRCGRSPRRINSCFRQQTLNGEKMGNLSFLSRTEIESLGPPTPDELEERGVSQGFLRDLTHKHVPSLANPTTSSVAHKLRLPLALTDELLYQL